MTFTFWPGICYPGTRRLDSVVGQRETALLAASEVQGGGKDDVAFDDGARLVKACCQLGVADAAQRARHLRGGVGRGVHKLGEMGFWPARRGGYKAGPLTRRLCAPRSRTKHGPPAALRVLRASVACGRIVGEGPPRPVHLTWRSSSSSRRTARTRLPSTTSAILITF